MNGLRTVLVLGSGGREHALAERLAASPGVEKVLVCPGNAGTARSGNLENVSGEALDVAARFRPDLVVVGPEGPLAAGVVDQFRAAGITVYGPNRAAAQLEGSKAFMKDFSRRHGIRTADYRVVRTEPELDAALAAFSTAPVVKADGLCAGKGVVVADSFEEARAAALGMLSGVAFGAAGQTVVLEERIDGDEASVHAICDGQRAFLLPAAQDHKRIGEGDTGPNTGGMGAYAPAPLVSGDFAAEVERDIILPTVRGMAVDGVPFIGTLFAGLMIRKERGVTVPYLLEINVRFGDPETQALMALIDGDFAGLLHSAARGALDPSLVTIAPRHAMCVVLAAGGYPGTPRSGDEIQGLEVAAQCPGVQVLHAGTKRDGERVVVSGGRVLGIVGSGVSLAEARAAAYSGIDPVRFAGMQFRRDIGHRALVKDAPGA